MLYGALFLMLAIRLESPMNHLIPFSILFPVLIAIFYINDLYPRYSEKFTSTTISRFVLSACISAVFAIIVFYLGAFYITPKTNLAVYFLILTGIFLLWRFIAQTIFYYSRSKTRIFFLHVDGEERLRDEIRLLVMDVHCKELVDSGYQLADSIDSADLVVAGYRSYREDSGKLFSLMSRGVTVLNEMTFLEGYLRETPVEAANTDWLLTQYGETVKREFELAKRGIECICSVVMIVVCLPLFLIVAIAVKLTSSGPIFYTQQRIGKLGRTFTIYKFRSMRQDAEANGVQWSTMNDPRVTPIGRILRHTHLDELPQLVNILQGDMSFVGPRPERPEFVQEIELQIPFYSLRHLIRPGVTGWAQISFPYGASIEDARRKLAFDLYYVKHRYWFFDLKILLKTFTMLFRGEGR